MNFDTATHRRLEPLSQEECMERLASQSIGRLGFVDEDGPIVLPVNYRLDRGTVIVRTAPGAKLDAAARRDVVAFEVDDVDPGTDEPWSVLVRGRAAQMWTPGEVGAAQALGLRPAAGAGVGEQQYIRIDPHTVTGRRIPREFTLAPVWLG